MNSPRPSTSTSSAARQAWVMLLALCLGFTLSQAYRTIAAIMAKPLQVEFHLSPSELGLFAAAFHFAFGLLQVLMGVGMDLLGVRRTVLAAFPLAVAGAALSALAPSFGGVMMGQVLIGIGCAPAFLACTVFIARQFPAERYAAVSGMVMSIGGVGLLMTGTPLAWVIDQWSWRVAFGVLAVISALAWLGMYALVRIPAPARTGEESVARAIRSFGELLLLPHTLGIVLLSGVTYASFIALRGLWLGPMLIERHGFSLVQSGNVALLVSLLGLAGPPMFGRIRARGHARRRHIIGFTLGLAAMFALLAFSHAGWLTVGLQMLIAFWCGYIVLQYADVRDSYPEAYTGRALSVFTMAMFLGIAVVQWGTGGVASWARGHGVDTYLAVNLALTLMLVVGAIGFRALPNNLGGEAAPEGPSRR